MLQQKSKLIKFRRSYNINEQRVPVNDGRYENRFNLSLEYHQIYGHTYSADRDVVIARYNRQDDTFYEEETGKPINYSDIKSWYRSYDDDDEIGMQIVYQATFKFDKNLSEIVVCYSMFGYYFVDVWFHTGEADDNSPNRINYIRTKSFLAAEKVYYEKLSDLNKKTEERR